MNLDAPGPDDVATFMENLRLTDEAVPESELPPPESPVSVVRSIRFPYELDQRINAAVEDSAATWRNRTELVVQMVEAGLNALQHDQLISKAEAIRLLMGLHPAGPDPRHDAA